MDTILKEKTHTIMAVDDTPNNLKILHILLEGAGYQVQSFTRPKEAAEAAISQPPDLFLLDISMPEMDGFELGELLRSKKSLEHIPILYLSALSGEEDKLRAFAAGGADYITKPFHVDEVLARVRTHLKLSIARKILAEHNISLEATIAEKNKEIYESQIATIFALAKLAEYRDNDTGKHVERVQAYTLLLANELAKEAQYAKKMTPEFIDNLFYASPLHDIGKVAIPDNILLKPGRLDKKEFEIIKTHTNIGAETLQRVHDRYQNNDFLCMGVAITRSHHERWDGTGYPDGLAGEDIPLGSRIMAIADVYDALRTKRVYKPPFPHKKTYDIIIEESGTHFEPGIVEVFKRIHPEFLRISKELEDKE